MRASYLQRALAGATFGLYMAHLLYFLNPQIEITPLRLLRAVALYMVSCGVLFGTALWLAGRLRQKIWPPLEAQTREHGFGWIVAAAFVSAGVFWMHALLLRIFLPIGAVRILTKATNLIAFTAFMLLLLWVAERNARPRASRLLIATGCALIAISSLILYQRRDRYRTDDKAPISGIIRPAAVQRPLLVVTLKDLPHDWLITMIGEERLPFLERATRESFFTRLEPFPATSPKALWASLATGKLPHRHGVTGRFSYRSPLLGSGKDDRFLVIPEGVGFRFWGLLPPVRRISAQLPAGQSLPFWALFERLGVRSQVIGWPVTSSTPPTSSVMVTENFFRRGPMPSDLHPAGSLGEFVRMKRTSPPLAPVTSNRFRQLGPAVEDQLRRAVSRDMATAAVARAGFEGAPLTVISLGGFSEALRAMNAMSNELPSSEDRRGAAIRAYAVELDGLIAAMATRQPSRTFVLVSLSGPRQPMLSLTPVALARELLGVDDPGAGDGFVLIRGEGVVHRSNPGSAQAVDIVPTLLFLGGLPVARDMDGRVLTAGFDDSFLRSRALSLIQTYEGDGLAPMNAGRP